MVKWVKSVIMAGIVSMGILSVLACTSRYETQLAENEAWAELGSYHGEQGYREWDEKELLKRGGWSDVDYEEYRAGYLQGRFEYCKGKRDVTVKVNPAYPDDCAESTSDFGLVDRGY